MGIFKNLIQVVKTDESSYAAGARVASKNTPGQTAYMREPRTVYYHQSLRTFEEKYCVSFEPIQEIIRLAVHQSILITGSAVTAALLEQDFPNSDIDIYPYSWDAFKSVLLSLTGFNLDCPEKGSPNSPYFIAEEDQKILSTEPSRVKFVQLKPTSMVRDPRPVQLIKMKWYSSAKEVLEDFDLSCNKFGVDYAGIHFSNKAIKLLEKGEFSVDKFTTPYLTAKRIKKYVDRGLKLKEGTPEDIIKGLGFGSELASKPREAHTLTQETSQASTTLWSNPEYVRDYYNMDVMDFQKKWEGKK